MRIRFYAAVAAAKNWGHQHLSPISTAHAFLDSFTVDWFVHRMLKGLDTDINLHVLSSGCPEIARILMFRDRLRGHPTDRDLYARTKLAVAQREWEHVQNYADAKSDVITDILTRS